MRTLRKHCAAWLIATAMATGATAHGTAPTNLTLHTGESMMTTHSLSVDAPDNDSYANDFITRMMFYKESFTGKDNGDNVSLLMDMQTYLNIYASTATADELKIADIIIKEMKRTAETSQTLKTLLTSCQEILDPYEIKTFLIDGIRFHIKQFAYGNPPNELLDMIVDKMERLAVTEVSQSELDELHGFYDKWKMLYSDDKTKAQLTRIGELLEVMGKTVATAKSNGVDVGYAKQLDQYHKDAMYADGPGRMKVEKSIHKLIKSHAKDMNQATLDYTRKVYDHLSFIACMKGERELVLSIAKTMDKIQDRLVKEKK